jgi:phage terminase small subunit
MTKDLEKAGVPFGLTYKEREFCLAYLRLGTCAPAMKEAGYAPSVIKSTAHKMLHKPHIAAFLRAQIEARFEQEKMSNAEIIARLARIARFDPRQLFKEDGSLKLPNELDEATAANLRSFELELQFHEDGAPPTLVKKVKTGDPVVALRTLAQIQKLLQPDAHQLNVFIDLDARMDAAAKRVREARERARLATDVKVVSEQ